MIEARARPRPGGGDRASSASIPENIVFTYQGDGDLASIGTAETVHAATRGENITIIFINNAIYGMTGGQMAPTSLPDQVTQTTPLRPRCRHRRLPDPRVRDALLPSTASRTSSASRSTAPKNVRKAKKAIKKAFENAASTAWATRSSRSCPPARPTGA